jgi:hypothetical protein
MGCAFSSDLPVVEYEDEFTKFSVELMRLDQACDRATSIVDYSEINRKLSAVYRRTGTDKNVHEQDEDHEETFGSECRLCKAFRKMDSIQSRIESHINKVQLRHGNCH